MPVLTHVDAYPATVRGPVTGNTSRVVTFSRLFVHDGRLYIAESRDRGRTITRVTSYDVPEGELTRRGRMTSWGPWSWSSCGCSSRWGQHSATALALLAEG